MQKVKCPVQPASGLAPVSPITDSKPSVARNYRRQYRRCPSLPEEWFAYFRQCEKKILKAKLGLHQTNSCAATGFRRQQQPWLPLWSSQCYCKDPVRSGTILTSGNEFLASWNSDVSVRNVPESCAPTVDVLLAVWQFPEQEKSHHPHNQLPYVYQLLTM